MNGVIIIALNKQAYATSAFNLALSIKHYNPSIHITLLTDNIHQACYRLEHYAMFDSIKEINKSSYTNENRFCPAKAKLSMYQYSLYDESLYLDADSVCLKDIAPLFEALKGCEFKSNYVEGYTQWVHETEFKNFFGFEQGKTINSSWIYWEKTEVFEQALEYYNLGFPKELLIQKWGNSLPDELFFNASLIKLGIDARFDKDVMFFDDRKDQRSITDISTQNYFMTFYGNANSTRLHFREWYDNYMFKICSFHGLEHKFKMHSIITQKHVNNRQ